MAQDRGRQLQNRVIPSAQKEDGQTCPGDDQTRVPPASKRRGQLCGFYPNKQHEPSKSLSMLRSEGFRNPKLGSGWSHWFPLASPLTPTFVCSIQKRDKRASGETSSLGAWSEQWAGGGVSLHAMPWSSPCSQEYLLASFLRTRLFMASHSTS